MAGEMGEAKAFEIARAKRTDDADDEDNTSGGQNRR
jgi:hypothetical protein